MAQDISAAVGAGGANRKQDVVTVQQLLNRVPVVHGGPEPKLKVDGLAWSKTNAAIRQFQKVYLGHKWPDGRVDPNGKTLAALNDFNRPEPKWFNYVVPGFKPLVGQPLNSNVCWAASYTMMRSWRDQKKYAIEDALGKVGKKYVDLYKQDKGLPRSESGPFLTRAGLIHHQMQCYPLETWIRFLKARGLVMIGALASPNSFAALHARVVEGIYGFENDPDGTWMMMLDPGWMGKKYNEPFAVFNAKYEGVMRAPWYASGNFQVSHY